MKRNQQDSQSTKSPFKNIIVGVDFSPYSKIVVKQAEKIAEQMQARLILVHAATLDWQMAGPEVYVTNVSLQELCEAVKKYYHVQPSARLHIEVRRGEPAETILKVAKSLSSPMIVVGSLGKNAVSRYILGSEAEKIALQSPYPVWIHRGRKIVPFKRVLVPTDLSSKSEKQISKIEKWAEALPLSLKYLYVKPDLLPSLSYPAYLEMSEKMQSKSENSLSQFRKKRPSTPLQTMVGTDPSEDISRVGKKYDVIAMNPHHKSGLLKRFGRITSKVIRLSDNPVLVLKT